MKHDLNTFTEHTTAITDNVGDQSVITDQLATLLEVFSDNLAEGIEYEKKIPELEDEITKLKDANMQLYLRLSAENQKKEEEKEEQEEETLTFENLFNEKGELK